MSSLVMTSFSLPFHDSNLPIASPNNFFAEGFFNNTCILTNEGDHYLNMGDCTPDSTLPNRMLLGDNTVLVPNMSTSITCGKTYSFPEVCILVMLYQRVVFFFQPCESYDVCASGSTPLLQMYPSCTFTLQWIALGFDAGTTIGPQPPTSTIIELARAVLSM